MPMTTAPEDVSAALHRLDEEFMANARAGDAPRMVERFYAPEACVLPPNREIVRGRAAIVQMWRGIMAAGLKDLALVTTEFDIQGEIAYGIGQYHMAVEPPGGARHEEAGKCLVVYRKQRDGEWRVVADMFSANQ